MARRFSEVRPYEQSGLSRDELENTKMRHGILRHGILNSFIVLALLLAPRAAFAVDPDVLKAQQRRVEVVQKVAPSVVAIFAPSGRGGGSGVLISPDGYTLTNFHVTKTRPFFKCGLNDGKVYDAVLVGIDPTGDVAMIKLLGRDDFPHATLGDSDKLQAGDWAYAMGNPFLLATDFQPTVTYGIISGVHRYQYPAGNNILEYTDCIQIDTSINPGNSGGPLFNEDGKLVGINGRGSFEKRGRVNSGAGYAISINQIKNFMGHLRSGRIVDHATLGATVETARNGDVVVSNILVESEAYRRGLEIGDVIVSFAGRPIRSVNQYKNVLGIYPKGWILPLTYRRDNQERTIYVRLQGLHRSTAFMPKTKNKKPPRGKPQPKPGKQPIPLRRSGGSAIPEKYKHMHVEKAGFANYYFNKLEQDRTLQNADSLGDFSNVGGTWILKAKDAKGKAVTFTLAKTLLGFEREGDELPAVQQLDQPLQDVPQGSGGLLLGLHSLKLFLTEGREGEVFPDFYYLGTEPLDGRGDLVDVLITRYVNEATGDSVDSRWYFHPDDGRFLGFDSYLDKDTDECRVRIESFREFNGRKLPGKFTVRSAGKLFGTFTLESAELRPPKTDKTKADRTKTNKTNNKTPAETSEDTEGKDKSARP